MDSWKTHIIPVLVTAVLSILAAVAFNHYTINGKLSTVSTQVDRLSQDDDRMFRELQDGFGEVRYEMKEIRSDVTEIRVQFASYHGDSRGETYRRLVDPEPEPDPDSD